MADILDIAKRSTRALEYGSGASTRLIAQKCEVVSVEHDLGWYIKLCEMAGENERIMPVFAPLSEPSIYAELPLNFGPFDLVVVDGRFRCRCLHAVAEALMPGATIVLHDSERSWYLAGKERYETIVEYADPTWQENPSATLWVGKESDASIG